MASFLVLCKVVIMVLPSVKRLVLPTSNARLVHVENLEIVDGRPFTGTGAKSGANRRTARPHERRGGRIPDRKTFPVNPSPPAYCQLGHSTRVAGQPSGFE